MKQSRTRSEKEVQFNKLLHSFKKAMQIASELLSTNPPPRFDQKEVDAWNAMFEMWGERSTGLKNNNVSVLKQYINDFLIYYQEGTDSHVELFWKKLKQENIPFKRVDKMAKILKRKKIKDQEEYDLIVDTMVPRLQQGEITQDEYDALSNMIGSYEERTSKAPKP